MIGSQRPTTVPGSAGLPARTVAAYAAPALALALPTIPVTVHLPSLYADRFGLATVGLVLFACRALDLLVDPALGWAGDRFGGRKLWLAIGAPLAGLALWRLFGATPPADLPAFALWATALYVGWSAFAINHAAWGAALSPDYHERSRLAAAREGLMLAGVMLAAVVPTALAGYGFGLREALGLLAFGAIAVGLPALAWALAAVPAVRTGPRSPTRFDPSSLRRNRPFLRLVGAWFVNGLANGLPATLFPLFMAHRLGADDRQTGIALLLYFAAGVLAIPLWLAASRRIGKHRAWIGAMTLNCVVFLPVPWITGLTPFLVVCVLSGAALGADLVLPPAMQADVADYDRWRFRDDRTGLLFAVWAMAQKLAAAAAVGLGFGLLALAGFRTAGGNEPGTLLALALIYAALPIVFKIMAILLMRGHPLDARRQDLIARRLARRASGGDAMVLVGDGHGAARGMRRHET